MRTALYNTIRTRLRVPAGAIVLLVVLVLLYDVGGAVQAIGDMIVALLANLIGGGDHQAVSSVLWRTLPLAMAAAGVTFAARHGWLKLNCLHSYVWMALIVLIGAIVGNACYEHRMSPARAFGPEATGSGLGGPIGMAMENQPPETLPAMLKLNASGGVAAAPTPTALERLASIRWLQKPDLNRPGQPVEPLQILPEGSGVYGSVSRAVNQLFGYLVAYEPRLFLASVISGSFVGWRLQRKLAVAQGAVCGERLASSQRDREKLAA